MPTITDATVVNSAYDTSGNGGRKLIPLSNGWLVAGAINAGVLYWYVSKNNGSTWTQLCYTNSSVVSSFAMVAKGVNVIAYATYMTSASTYRFDATTVTNTALFTSDNLETGQTSVNGASLAINETGTELSAVWASRGPNYPNSYNIRYAKGTINGDGSVSWGASIQGSTVNTVNHELYDPTAFYAGGVLRIIAHYKTVASHYIRQYSGTIGVLNLDATIVDSGNVNYTQTLPSAIYVPQSVNGLANGRIWAAWQGADVYVSSGYRLFASYSDNYGTTWSTPAVVSNDTSRSYYSPSLTASKTNEVFVLYHSSMNELLYAKTTTGTWGTPVVVKNILNPYVSALYDPTVKFTFPLFIYRDTAKVGFYGTWTVTSISVTPGSLGLKTDRTNLLTYTITTDGTMSTITESVNGTVVATKNATSGQSLIAGLTQAQWDLIKYGKYKDATGGLNTLTVNMGTETWTYTFDKRPASDADIMTHMQALKDGADYYVPSVKAKLIARTNGSVNDSFENIINGINLGKKFKTGTAISSATQVNTSNPIETAFPVSVSGLTFKPSVVIIKGVGTTNSGDLTTYTAGFDSATSYTGLQEISLMNPSNTLIYCTADSNYYVDSTSFKLPVGGANRTVTWWAFE